MRSCRAETARERVSRQPALCGPRSRPVRRNLQPVRSGTPDYLRPATPRELAFDDSITSAGSVFLSATGRRSPLVIMPRHQPRAADLRLHRDLFQASDRRDFQKRMTVQELSPRQVSLPLPPDH